MACGQQKVKGGHGSNIASSSASSSASSITLNLGVGCAPSCWPILGFRNLLGARRGAEGSFLCSLITDFLAEGAGWGASPGRGGEVGCQGLEGPTRRERGWRRLFLRRAYGIQTSQGRGGLGCMDHTLALGAFRIARGAG